MHEDCGDHSLTTEGEGRIDPAVVAALYVEHAEELRKFLIGVLRSSELAAEALQATFSKAVEVGHTARRETLKGWLFRVAFNESMGIRRSHKTHEKSIRRLAWSQPSRNDSPEENVSRWEVVNRVRAAMQQLPAEQLTVVQMPIYEEKTFATIADELNLPLGTILTRMRLALQKLEAELKSKE